MIATVSKTPKRTRGKPSADGDFFVYEHVPIFDEHEGDDGVYYDERLLRAIADNCNRRIKTTGDWTPIVIAHTREQKDKKHAADDPPVVGLCGPFYVADFTNPQGKVVPCIHATFWVFAEDDEEFRKNPRRSVEIWPEDKPEDRYFDPISVLGAETPKRDLGLIYSRRRRRVSRHQKAVTCVPGLARYCISGPFRYSKRSTANVLKYQEGAPASSGPGPNNTFIPDALGTEKKKPQKHSKGDGFMLSPEDLQQIVEALKPTIQAIVDSATVQADETLPPDASAMPDASMDPAAMAPPPDAQMDDGIPNPDSMDDDSKLYAKGLGRKFMKYFKDGELGEDSKGFHDSLDDDDKKHLGSFMKYMCDDDGAKQKYSERYAKSPIGGEDITEKPGDSSPSGSMNEEEMKKGEPEKYRKLRKERDDSVLQYRKLQADHESLRTRYAKQEVELVEVRKKEKYSKRYSEMMELEGEGYVLEAKEEVEATIDFTEDQWDAHKHRIRKCYNKVSGEIIPIGHDRAKKFPSGEDKSEKYAKTATALVQKYRKEGRELSYDKIVYHLIEKNGSADEATLVSVAS